MFTKSLVSIYFSNGKVTAAELDSSRKKVKKTASLDIPEGVINQNKIIDKKKMTSLLQDLWQKNSFGSKDVGIIIPEFSTFTKLMTLPKLSTSEIGEAVNFQAQEYLPNGIEDMVLDWKILEKTDKNTEVLMVAVAKDVLMDFVDSCVQAGLFPVAVETPSISIGNVVKSEEGYIAILVEDGQTLIVSGEKKKIFGTSVTRDKTISSISTSLSRIIKHFSKVKFSNIFVGGEAVTNEIFSGLKTSYKMNVSVLDPSLNGDPDLVQKYLAPLSMLKSPIAEPSDPSTLNLLPVDLVDRYQKQKVRNQVWSLTLTITVFVWISLLVTLGAFMVLTQQSTSLKSQSQKTAQIAAEAKKSEAQAIEINNVVNNVLKIKNTYVAPETIINRIFGSTPQGVSIEVYDIDLDKGNITLRGVSSDRQSLVTFKENLEGIEGFSSVNIPISSFEEVSNLPFTISFTYALADTKKIPALNINN